MTPFRDRPVEQKLLLLIIVITTSALLLSGFVLVVTDAVLFHRNLTRDLSTFARVIADNSTASLMFDDARSAGEILAALRARTHVISACLFRPDGSLLAEYVREGATGSCGIAATHDGIRSTLTEVTVYQAVVLKERRIGSLTVVYDFGELTARIRIWGITVIAVLALSSLAAVLLSFRLRRRLVTPILELAATAGAVTTTRDYTVRARQRSRDEIGLLAGAFNQMLAGIETRDSDLRTTLEEREQALESLAEVNRKLQQSNEELARSNQDLERFAFVASHDMQEPLRMVAIYSQLLVNKCGVASDELVTYRDYVVAGTTRMRELIADLLSYIEITTAPREMKPVDLNIVIAKVKENLRMAIQETGAVVTVDSLPFVAGQESHLISLFQNLVGNAIKYRGDQVPRVSISAQVVDGSYTFAVSDNGLGIAPQYHGNVFLPFKRLHGKDIPGTGIGLAICQRIVERYGGRIWVESEAGQGASFKFALPKPATVSENSIGRSATR